MSGLDIGQLPQVLLTLAFMIGAGKYLAPRRLNQRDAELVRAQGPYHVRLEFGLNVPNRASIIPQLYMHGYVAFEGYARGGDYIVAVQGLSRAEIEQALNRDDFDYQVVPL